jgi:DNA-directed RNA polymerase subunit RPC12/RpoP
MGRQNLPRDQWLEIGAECPHCGERITESEVYSLRPVPEDPKLALLYCPNCGDRVQINHI